MISKLIIRQFARQVKKTQFLNQFKNTEFQNESLIQQDIFNDDFSKQIDQIQEISQDKSVMVQKDEIINDFNQPIDKEQLNFIQETLLYQGEDQFPDKLVHRPEKQVYWGLGGELLRIKQNVFQKNRNPNVDEVIKFLELEQCKDISVVNMKELDRTDMPDFAIIATTYSESHGYKVGQNLIKAVEKLNIKNQINKPVLYGKKDDGWQMVTLKEINVHLQTQESRDEIFLEYRWKNPVPQEEIDEINKVTMRKRKRAIYQPLEE